MELKQKPCSNKMCLNTFPQYNSLQKFCSAACKKEAGKNYHIPIMSVKQVKLLEQYKELRLEFLAKKENQKCPVTGDPATEVHHMKKKRGFADDWARDNNIPLYIDVRYFLAVSRGGHEEIEDNPEWAYEMGYSLHNNYNE